MATPNFARGFAASLLLMITPAMSIAQSRSAGRDSVASVMSYLRTGASLADIVGRTNIDCLTFPFAALDAEVRRVSNAPDLTRAMMQKCARLLVRTDPPGASVKVGDRSLGSVGQDGAWLWANPDVPLSIEATNRIDRRTALGVSPVRGKVLDVTIELLKETAPVTPERSPEEIAKERGLWAKERRLTPEPVRPVARFSMGARPYGALWGLAAGVVALGSAVLVPQIGCYDTRTVPSGQTWRVHGRNVPAGQSVNLGGGTRCAAMVSVSAAVGVGVFASILRVGTSGVRRARFLADSQSYQRRYAEWERGEWQALGRRPEVQTIADEERRKQDFIRSENAAIAERNRQIHSEPRRDLREFALDTSFLRDPFAVALQSEVDLPIYRAAAPNPNGIAVVIGNRDYQRAPRVDYAARDAAAVATQLVYALGFSPQHVQVDTNVTSGRLNETFGTLLEPRGDLANRIDAMPQPDSVDVFVYYSGHGYPGGKGDAPHILPVDANPQALAQSGYNLNTLYSNLGLIAKRVRSVTVVIDACFSGRFDRGQIVSGSSVASGVRAETKIGGRSLILAATGPKQIARWNAEQGHGVFTYFFLKGLQGEADKSPRDMVVTSQELDAYLRDNVNYYVVNRLKGDQQVPEATIEGGYRTVSRLRPVRP